MLRLGALAGTGRPEEEEALLHDGIVNDRNRRRKTTNDQVEPAD
jgi:hypothetical protein